ncbi:unnamed protein product [Calypogeia fissa]
MNPETMGVLKEHLRAADGRVPPAKSVWWAWHLAQQGGPKRPREPSPADTPMEGARRNTDREPKLGDPQQIGQRGIRPKSTTIRSETEKATFLGHIHEKTPKKGHHGGHHPWGRSQALGPRVEAAGGGGGAELQSGERPRRERLAGPQGSWGQGWRSKFGEESLCRGRVAWGAMVEAAEPPSPGDA